MVRCKHCGAENYAIDMWCSNCSHHLDWAPAAAIESPVEHEIIAPVVPAEAAAPVEAPRAEEPVPVATPYVAPPYEPEVAAPRSRQRTAVWFLPAAAAAALAALLALPVAGWFNAAGHQQVTPQLPLTAASNQATPTPTPTPTLSPTVTPSPIPTTQAPPVEQAPITPPVADHPVPVPAVQRSAGDPTGRVAGFYQAVAAHQFDAAAAAWSAQMQANYPPSEFINHRFAYTQGMNLRAARVLANNGQVSTVYVDLIEVYAGTTRHWVGTWQLVSSSSGWLLNQPNLRAA
jgi:hypothetical protein